MTLAMLVAGAVPIGPLESTKVEAATTKEYIIKASRWEYVSNNYNCNKNGRSYYLGETIATQAGETWSIST
jgi:hypothetical protein